MNIFDAWKLAKDGQKIYSPSTRASGTKDFNQQFSNMSFSAIYADDWEVVKEKKKESMVMKIAGKMYSGIYQEGEHIEFPAGSKVTIEWEE